MRNKIGIFCMFLGAALILGALSLFLWNRHEEVEAEEAVVEVMPPIREEIRQVIETAPEIPTEVPNIPVELLTEEDLVMTEKKIRGYPYIGYLTIADLKLELPIMTSWTYSRLKVSPCRYTGTVRGEDLVIMAHNYSTHFGKLSELSEGAQIVFTDMDGTVWYYEVAVVDVLDPTAIEEMVAGDYDLTLFTCTPGGSHRVTVRCDMVNHT